MNLFVKLITIADIFSEDRWLRVPINVYISCLILTCIEFRYKFSWSSSPFIKYKPDIVHECKENMEHPSSVKEVGFFLDTDVFPV